MKNFTKLLLFIILIAGWQGLSAQTVIYSQSFGTVNNAAITTLPGWALTGTGNNIGISTGGNGGSYQSPPTPTITYSNGANLQDIGTTAGKTETATVSGQISTVNFVGIKLDYGYRLSSSKYAGTITVDYSINGGSSWTNINTTTIAGTNTVPPSPYNIGGTTAGFGLWYTVPTVSLPVGAEGLSDLQFRWTYARTGASGNFEIEDVTISGTPTTPTVSTGGVSTLSGFYTATGTASFSQTYNVSGSNLGTNTLNVTAPTGFEVSKDNTSFSGSVSYTPTSGSVTSTPVYVRIAASASVGTPSGNTSNASTGATTVNVAVSGTVLPAPVAFTPGNIVVNRSGTGAAALTSGATIEFLDEYTTSGTLVQTIMLPAAVNGSNRILTESGSASSDGMMTLSLDGQKLVVTGYDAAPGTSSVVGTAAATNGRVIGTVDYNGNINTSTRITDGFDANNIRCASTIDGSAFWAAGAGNVGGDGGTRYITSGSTTSTQLSSSPANSRAINIFENQLYTSGKLSGSSPGGINAMGSGIPTTSGQTTNNISSTTVSTDPYSFAVLRVDAAHPGPDVMYVGDQTGGLFKFISANGGATWTASGTLTGVSSGLTASISGSSVILYVTVGAPGTVNTIRAITDANATTSTLSGALTTTGTLVATASANTTFRGMAFAPQALAGTPSVSVASGGPSIGSIAQGSVGNVLYQLNLSASVAKAILTNLTLTTAGSYSTSDFVANTFKLYYSTDATLDASDELIGTSAIVASGGSVTFNVAQIIASGANGFFFLTGDVAGAATAGHNINITATSLSNIVLADGASKSGTVAAGGVQTIAPSILPTVFYSNGGNLDDINNWGDNTDGTQSIPTVTGPVNFTTAGYTFNVANGSTTINANWTVSGTNSKVIVTNGQSFTVPSNFSFTGKVDVNAGATLTLLNGTVPTLGTLDAASTVVFGSTSASQSVPGANYGNLTLSGAGTKVIADVFSANPINVAGNLVFDNTSVDRTLTTLQTIGFSGDLTVQNGITYTSGYSAHVNLEAKGSASQNIIGNGFPVNANRFYINVDNNGNATANKPSGSVSLSSANGGTSVVLTGDIRFNCGSASPANTATFADNGNSITVGNNVGMDGSSANYNFTGTLILNGSTGTQNLYQNGVGGATSLIKANLNNVSIQTSGSAAVQVQPSTGSATLIIAGSFSTSSTSSGKFTPNGNTIKIAGNFTDSKNNDLIAAGTSTFEFNGATAQTISTKFTSGESFFNVKINNANGVNLSGTAGIIKVGGNLNVASGILNSGSGKVILGSTATITEDVTDYVIGVVQTTRTLTTGTNETFGGLGIEVNAAGSAPGSTLATRTTGSSIAVGCSGSSILRNFNLVPSTNTGLNATLVFHYSGTNATEMNNYDPTELSFYGNPGSGWSIVPATSDVVGFKFTATSLNSINHYTAGLANPKGGTATATGGTALNPNTTICNSTGTTITLTGFSGSIVWQTSTDGQTGWNTIGGATSATYNTGNLSASAYYRALVSNACFDIASNSVLVNVLPASPALALTLTSDLASGAVAATWTPNAVNTGVQYNIAWSGASNGSSNNVNSGFNIPGLTAGSTYSVTVSEVTPAGCPATGTASVNTLCTAPVLTLGTPTATAFTASWTNTGATSYRLFMKRAGYTSFSSIVVAGTSHTFIGLYPGNSYVCYVAANDCPVSGAVGLQSAELLITTLPNATACTIPTITAVSNCANQISISLSGSPTGSYRLIFGRVSPNQSATVSYAVTGSLVTVNVGTQNASSVWQIYASSTCSGGGASTLSNAVYVVVKPGCSQIQNLVLSTPDCLGFYATWNANTCQGNLVNYEIYIRKQGALGYNGYPAGTNNFEHVGWIPKGTYTAYVAAVGCNTAVGPASTIQTITTGTGCGRTEDDATAADDATTATQNNTQNTVMNIYPNPTSGNFMVNVYTKDLSEQNIKIEMTNSLGQVVYTVIAPVTNGISNNAFQVPQNLAAGMYFIHTIVNGENLSQRIMYTK